MGRTFIKPGDTMTFTAPAGGVTSGVPVLIGNMLVIPETTAAQTLPFEGMVVGVHLLAKATGIAWTEGMLLYWDNAAKNLTNVTTSNYRVGVAAKAAASGDVTGYVRLNGCGVPTGA